MAPYTKVVAVGRCISGNLLSTNGKLTYDLYGSEDNEDRMLSTCRITEAWEGGPLLDIKGNFVGMNLHSVNKIRTVFLPARRILELSLHVLVTLRRSRYLAELENSQALRRSLKKDKKSGGISRSSKNHKRTHDDISKNSKRSKTTWKITWNGEGKITESLNSVIKRNFWTKRKVGALDSLGYPKPLKHISKDRQVLVHSFEETFGETYNGGVWSEMRKTVASNISRNVVALASFYGETRTFACTGFFIKWNGCTTILTSASLVSKLVGAIPVGKLRIEVLLPNNECKQGTLLHYNLRYNVALVSVKDFWAPRPANVRPMGHNESCKLIAVGRCFKSGMLMAASGKHINVMESKLDCKLLQYSTCAITKAGIGGPLVDFDGNFIGMNFFVWKVSETAFLPSDVILDVLACFEKKGSTVADVGLDYHPRSVLDWSISGDRNGRPYRWHVPEPFWCRSEFADKLSYIRPHNPRSPAVGTSHVFCVNGKKIMFL